MPSTQRAAIDDVIVLGGGVIGLACAQALAERGRGVRLLERGALGAATSHGNCGTLTPSHSLPLAAPGMVATALKWMTRPDAPFYVKPRWDPALWLWLLRFASRCNQSTFERAIAPKAALLKASQDCLSTLVRDRALQCEHSRDGLHYVYRDPKVFEAAQRTHALLADHGVVVEAVSGASIETDEPALKKGVAGALFFPGDGHLRPERYATELARVARLDGALIEEDVEVVSARRESGAWLLHTKDGQQFRCRELLLAAGPWAARFARQFGLRLPIQPGKGYSITYDRPSLVPRRPMVLKERSVCVTVWADGFRLGSTMEFSGYDNVLNRARLDALERGAAEYLNEPVGPAKREEWFGWRPMTWDDLPVLGAVPGAEGLWLAVGHGMMGVSMSAATGRLMADLVTGSVPIIDPAPYRISRFG